MKHEETMKKIIGAAMTVLNELKPGLDEKLYERALKIELEMQGVTVEQQKRFDVSYRGEAIGTLVPDLIVGGCVVVDAKVVSTFNDSHITQMIGYLTITRLEVSLLINFKHSKLEWKRIVH